MGRAAKRRVYIGLALAVLVLFVAGMVAGYADRKQTICKDGKPPVAEQDQGPLANVLFRCQNGQTVTSSE